MVWLLFLPIVIALAVVFFVIVRSQLRTPKAAAYLYTSKSPLSEVEQIFYWRLKEALPECEIFPQVALSRFLQPTSGGLAAFRSISQKTVDYLVVTKSFDIVAAVELDDASHRTKGAKDAVHDKTLLAVGIKTLRYKTTSMPGVEQLRAAFV